ncbi:cilia- and flagella-associated protein 100-like [Homalodisca vitripennis]|uniref:cilia- and flagella-associated protein 100-like n=1 Tax=Homalodisca vitripennis TaxID=197043 RepID=UPI001EEC0EC1|nr:cilia- and flagella-associated protein 100-like [Homalodisca vitripennis]XP_046659566.1 cilia- and flagella-associated protein 100-like [Homalodisca vitripennis]KAG8274411.1 Cilia- and flagella-associated protein 100 [Homalodisca vitripennis]
MVQDRPRSSFESLSAMDRPTLMKKLKKEQNFKIVKPTVNAPKIIDKVFHRSRQPQSVYYFTSGRKVNPQVVNELEKKKKAYSFPPIPPVGVPHKVLRQVEKDNLKEKERGLSAMEKPSRRMRLMENLAERVYVPPRGKFHFPSDSRIVDDQYFAVIKGRPIKEKFSVRNYIQEVRETLLTNLRTGFLQDEVYLIDEQHRNEKRSITELTELFKNYYASFKEFEAQDHEEWLLVRRTADDMAAETSDMRAELKQLMKELSQIRCNLYVLEEKWRNCKLCQIFLHQISPLSWQEEHPLRDKNGKEITSINDMFDRYKLDTEGSVQSLNELIDIFQEDIAAEERPPELYFTDPWQVRLVFREMELQHLSSLLIIESIRKPKDTMLQGLQAVKEYYDAEIKTIEDQLENAEKHIKQEEERAEMLEGVAKDLLNTEIKYLVSSETTILTHVFVEHAYEECIASGDTDMTTIETLQALKLLYEDLMIKLDSLPCDIVKEAEAAVQTKNAIALEKAHQARRQVALLDNLSKSMKRALDKPFVRHGKPLMWRSKPPSPKHRSRYFSRKYSPRELEYLIHFTDYCPYEDEEAVKLFFPLGT